MHVDLARGDRFHGDVVALQIKSGEKYRRGADFKIPCGAVDIALWRGSNVPIYGMVYDVATNRMHGAALSEWARRLDYTHDLPKFCPVPAANVLKRETLLSWGQLARQEMREREANSQIDLYSPDSMRQVRAAHDCYALGMFDARPLLMLRRSLEHLKREQSLWTAIQVLPLATPHPDVYWTDDNWIEDGVGKQMAESSRWSPAEARLLLVNAEGRWPTTRCFTS